MIRITPNSESKVRSRSCSTTPVRLFPVIEHLLGPALGIVAALPDFRFDVGAPSGPARSAAVVEVGRVGIRLRDIGHEHLLIAMRTAFQYQVPLRQVLQDFAEALAAVERGGDLIRI